MNDACQNSLLQLRQRLHGRCFACGTSENAGIGQALSFSILEDGSVAAELLPSAGLQGYDQVLHGGVIATLFDAAMIHCLFARKVVALTARLNLRFRRPVQVQQILTVKATLTGCAGQIYTLQASLVQGGKVAATATGQFVRSPAIEAQVESFSILETVP